MEIDESGGVCDACFTFKKPVLWIEGSDRNSVKICRRCTEEAAEMWSKREARNSGGDQ